MEQAPIKPRRHRLRHWLVGTVVVVAVVAGAVKLVISQTPTPGALIIRTALNAQSADTKKAMAKHVARGVGAILDQRYGSAADPAAGLDVYFPTRERGPRPTLVWFHGGGWLAGDKADAAPYFRLIAEAGFTVVSVGYSLAPEHHYPAPVREANQALQYVQVNAARLHVDAGRITLGGDSAGAQIASQVAALITNPAYARKTDLAPLLAASRLRGTVLDCGVFDLSPYVDGDDEATNGVLGFAISTLMWSYTGTKDKHARVFTDLSTIDHVTAAYPPTFITGGNADPLTASQSRPFAAKLRSLGVRVDERFFPAGHEPRLEHEYQLDLDTADGRETLRRTIAFLRGLG